MATQFEGDLIVQGTIRAGGIVLPNNSIGDNQISISNPIQSEKLEHQHEITHADSYAATVATFRKAVHVAYAAGEVTRFQIGAVIANIGDSTVVVQLLKNGTNILSSTLDLDSGDAAFAKVVGAITIGAVAYVAGDVFEISVTATAGTGTLAKGFFANLVLRESAGA